MVGSHQSWTCTYMLPIYVKVYTTMISDPLSSQDSTRSHQNGSTLTNDPSGTPRPQHANGGFNVIPEDMAAVSANDVAEQQTSARVVGTTKLKTIPTCTCVRQRCSNEFQKTAKVIHPSVKRFAAGTDLALSHNSTMGMQDLGASRGTLPSSFTCSACLRKAVGGGERPTHELGGD